MSKIVVGKIEQLTETRTVTIENTMENIKVGIDAFNDLARSHDAHVKESERLREEVKKLKLRIEELEDYKVKITQKYIDLLE